jgi:hypothetical protein
MMPSIRVSPWSAASPLSAGTLNVSSLVWIDLLIVVRRFGMLQVN